MSVKDKTEQAKASVEKAYTNAKEGAERAYDSARAKAVSAYDNSRQAVQSGARRTGEGIEDNPLIALGGGLALGLIIGALLPRSEREKRALSKVGSDINSRAHSAYDAAKDAGSRTLEERGLTPNKGEDVLRNIVKGVGAAARSSADAATKAAKRE